MIDDSRYDCDFSLEEQVEASEKHFEYLEEVHSGNDTMISRQELKPCPFCGSIATIESYQFYASYYIRCNGCNVKTPSNSDIGIIVKLWNQRRGERHD